MHGELADSQASKSSMPGVRREVNFYSFHNDCYV
jgi:hypothetical protein